MLPGHKRTPEPKPSNVALSLYVSVARIYLSQILSQAKLGTSFGIHLARLHLESGIHLEAAMSHLSSTVSQDRSNLQYLSSR